MKSFILSIIAVITFNVTTAQEQLKEVVPEKGNPFLLGNIMIEDLKTGTYYTWYQKSYGSYNVDTSKLSMLKTALKGYKLKLFLGTWCGDSKREVPKIIKILERADFAIANLEIIALDRRPGNYKKGPNGEEKGWNITRVPTLLFLNDGKEVNRIVERPIESFEKDMLSILQNRDYIPNYSLN